MIALIPARSGSKRIPDKNIRKLNGHPLICYSIWLALDSEMFDGVYVSTDSEYYADISDNAGAEVIMRPGDLAEDDSTDLGWIQHAITILNSPIESFAILRPTNPFRTVELVKRAILKFQNYECDSIRCVEPIKQHPRKMWQKEGLYIIPAFDSMLHNSYNWPTQKLQEIWPLYVQNAALEMCHVNNLYRFSNHTGNAIVPIEPRGYEAFDINDEIDWITAEALISKGLVELPRR